MNGETVMIGSRRVNMLRSALGGHLEGAVAVWLVAVWYFGTYQTPRLMPAEISMYVAQPLLWLSVVGLVWWLWRREGSAITPVSRWVLVFAALGGAFQVALVVLSGVLGGFGMSPYDHSWPMVALNLWYVVIRLVGLEMARWYLVAGWRRRGIVGPLAAGALLWLIAVPLGSWPRVGLIEVVFPFAGRTLLPAAGESLVATYLAVVGGPFAALTYRGVMAAFEWLSPILPNAPWPLAAFCGTAGPILALVIIHDILKRGNAGRDSNGAPSMVYNLAGTVLPVARSEATDEEEESSTWGFGWLIVALVVVAMLWFNTGMFGIKPVLTSGQSMEPNIHVGDIAIVRQGTVTDIDDVKVGEVIAFKHGTISVLHRVVDIREDKGQKVIITKGDNNNTTDEPITVSLVEGHLIALVPKLGWLPIGIKTAVTWVVTQGKGG